MFFRRLRRAAFTFSLLVLAIPICSEATDLGSYDVGLLASLVPAQKMLSYRPGDSNENSRHYWIDYYSDRAAILREFGSGLRTLATPVLNENLKASLEAIAQELIQIPSSLLSTDEYQQIPEPQKAQADAQAIARLHAAKWSLVIERLGNVLRDFGRDIYLSHAVINLVNRNGFEAGVRVALQALNSLNHASVGSSVSRRGYQTEYYVLFWSLRQQTSDAYFGELSKVRPRILESTTAAAIDELIGDLGRPNSNVEGDRNSWSAAIQAQTEMLSGSLRRFSARVARASCRSRLHPKDSPNSGASGSALDD